MGASVGAPGLGVTMRVCRVIRCGFLRKSPVWVSSGVDSVAIVWSTVVVS